MIKDWKKTKNTKTFIIFDNRLTNITLWLKKDKEFGSWYIDLWTNTAGKTIKILKTKQQALKFAKSYMKTH